MTFKPHTPLDGFRHTDPFVIVRHFRFRTFILLILFPQPLVCFGFFRVKKLADALLGLTKCFNTHSPLRSPGKWETEMQIGPFLPTSLMIWHGGAERSEPWGRLWVPASPPACKSPKLPVKWPMQSYRASRGNAHEIDLEVLGNCKLRKNHWSE